MHDVDFNTSRFDMVFKSMSAIIDIADQVWLIRFNLWQLDCSITHSRKGTPMFAGSGA